MTTAATGTKEKLLDAAIELFAANGFVGASTREICALAEANAAALNYHWGSKEALWEAAYEWSGQWFMQRIGERLDPTGPPREALPALLGHLFDALLEDSRPLRIFVWGALQDSTADAFEALDRLEPLRVAWRGYAAMHGLKGDIETIAVLVYGQLVYVFVDRVGQRHLFGRDVRDPEHAARMKAAVMANLRAALGG